MGKKEFTLKPINLVVAGVIILALIGGGIFIGANWNKWFGEKSKTSTSANIDEAAQDWSENDLPNKTQESSKPAAGIQIPGYPSINIPANQPNVQIALLNPKGNPCYFTFTLVLKDSGEILYTSKQVPPGKAVTKQTLSRGLSSGKYKAIIKITTNSLADMSPMNGANVETELVVK